MSNRTNITDLTKGNLTRQLVRFSAPFVASNLLQTAYTLTDLAIVGKFVGNTGLSAVSICGQVLILITFIGNAFASGGQIYIAQLVGAGGRQSIKTAIPTMFFITVTSSLLITGACAGFSGGILSALNTPPEAVSEASDYFLICCGGTVFVFGYNMTCAILRGMGNSRVPLILIAISAAANILLDLLFVCVFSMGAAGAALATVLSQALSCVCAVGFLYKMRAEHGFDFKLQSFKADSHALGIILKLSLPLVLMQCCINLSMLYVNSYINAYGVAASAVAGIGNKLFSIVTAVSSAFIAALATVVGQNIAAGEHRRIVRAVFTSWLFTLGFAAVLMVLAKLFSRWIFGIFTSDEAILDMAVPYFNITIWLYLSFGLLSPPLGLINGVGFTSLNLLISVLDGVVARIGLSLLFGVALGMGLEGFWLGGALAGYVSAILGGAYFFSGKWKTRKLMNTGSDTC